MKIDELVNSINGLRGLQAVKGNKSIDIYSSAYSEYDYFLDLYFAADSWNEVNFDCDCLDGVKPDKLGLALQYVDEFLKTPIKERFPEKKYRLRWIDDDDGTTNYLYNPCGTWSWSSAQRGIKVFTEKELQQLKINNPRLAPAIDAMKEPVEED